MQRIQHATNETIGGQIYRVPVVGTQYRTGKEDVLLHEAGMDVAIGVRMQHVAELDAAATEGDVVTVVEGGIGQFVRGHRRMQDGVATLAYCRSQPLTGVEVGNNLCSGTSQRGIESG